MYLTKARNLFFVVLAINLTACSALPNEIGGKWRSAIQGIEGYVFGYDDYPITEELVAEIPYASLKLKIGKGPAGLLILQEIKNEDSVWVSSDNASFVIRNGRIIRTAGLLNNISEYYISEKDSTFNQFLVNRDLEKTSYRTLSLSNPEVRFFRLKVKTKALGKRQIKILGREIETLLIEEFVSNEYIRWESKNLYWIDISTGYVWKSEQQFAPNIPVIYIEVLKKPA